MSQTNLIIEFKELEKKIGGDVFTDRIRTYLHSRITSYNVCYTKLLRVLSKQPRPNGPNLTILTNAGGPGVLAVDALITNGGALTEISPDAMNRITSYNVCYTKLLRLIVHETLLRAELLDLRRIVWSIALGALHLFPTDT